MKTERCNLQYYKDTILEIVNNGDYVGLANNRPVPCSQIACEECGFYDLSSCKKTRIKWFIEPAPAYRKLLEQEVDFLESLNPNCFIHFTGTHAFIYKTNKGDTGITATLQLATNTFLDVNTKDYFRIGALLAGDTETLERLFNVSKEQKEDSITAIEKE